MAAFERIRCGIEGLDQVFDNIRLGDNVVWQLDTLDQFRLFSDPFVDQAVLDGYKVHYMRFASHEPLVEDKPGVVTHRFNPNKGFEAFTIDVRSVITEQGFEAIYVFDCLSDLQVAWSADMMMGNFFRVTCPYLFELDTVAYFPVLRGQHSFDAIAKIRDTTQLLIDVYADRPTSSASPTSPASPASPASPEKTAESSDFGEMCYIHPIKVWNRYSPMMFLAYRYDPSTGEVKACSNGVDSARFYELMNKADFSGPDRNVDSWERFFAETQQRYRDGTLDEDTCTRMCNMMMTKDPFMRDMVRRYFEPTDYFSIRDRMVGTGLVGGKACGMLLARKIVESKLPQFAGLMETHDSFYLGTDVFYSYIVSNGLWGLRIAQRSDKGFIEAAPALQEGLLKGVFTEDIREQFRRILEHYGQSPIIVRSSSFLEDGFGNAFAGKYKSVFCANVGTPEMRLEAFENAIRTVYASTMDPSALEYRMRNGLDEREEQMALLVQRVSGSYCTRQKEAPLVFPTAAGVGFSHAAFRFMEGTDPEAGMLRLVTGLGTKAVDRTREDYPRLVSLDKPTAVAARNIAERHRYSQHYADVIDLERGEFVEINVQDLIELLPDHALQAIFEHDYDAERLLYERGKPRNVMFASCKGLVEDKRFVEMMASILRSLQEAYGCAVDIEYTVNIGANNDFAVNLLQCRPLRTVSSGMFIDMPELTSTDTLFKVHGEAMGASRSVDVDALVVVDPQRYYNCPHVLKPTIANIVGEAGTWFKKTWPQRLGVATESENESSAGGSEVLHMDRMASAKTDTDSYPQILLLAPGRLGTSSPELGVPVTFAQIAAFTGICEIAYSQVGYAPELSYGSHMFQDLVEADIYYAALLEDPQKATYYPEFLDSLIDITSEAIGEACTKSELDGIVKVYDARKTGLHLWHNHIDNESICGTR